MGNYISPLRRAIRARNPEKVEQLVKDAGESAADYINEDYTADCFCACMFKNTKSTLHTAISCQQFSIVKVLLYYGADPQCTSSYLRQTPLHVACRQNHLELSKLLIEEYNVDLEARDELGNCPVHTSCLAMNAILVQDISMLKYFEEKGQLSSHHLCLTNDDGNTPLHIACQAGHIKAVEYLISLGANRQLCNNEGETPDDILKRIHKKPVL